MYRRALARELRRRAPRDAAGNRQPATGNRGPATGNSAGRLPGCRLPVPGRRLSVFCSSVAWPGPPALGHHRRGRAPDRREVRYGCRPKPLRLRFQATERTGDSSAQVLQASNRVLHPNALSEQQAAFV